MNVGAFLSVFVFFYHHQNACHIYFYCFSICGLFHIIQHFLFFTTLFMWLLSIYLTTIFAFLSLFRNNLFLYSCHFLLCLTTENRLLFFPQQTCSDDHVLHTVLIYLVPVTCRNILRPRKEVSWVMGMMSLCAVEYSLR